MKRKNAKKIFGYLFLFMTLFSIDRLIKFLVLKDLSYKNWSVFKGLNFYLILNRGVSFGLFSSSSSTIFYLLTTLIFLVITLFVFFSILEYIRGTNIFWHIFIIAGAYSNILDRFLYKGVIDFIDFYIGYWHWPTFNLADIFIVVGVFGLLGGMFKNVYFKKN
ncbi:signal peptidase II [Candidatus Dependentiae bacterium]|nr:signal peptidase II [Candidatus Dependentiae bacterium]